MSKYPTSLYSEIAPNLFMGGTDDADVIHRAAPHNTARKDLPFDAIVTMYAWARPADWKVQEFRYGIYDSAITEIDLDRLKQAVEFGYNRWLSGDRLLVRCQAGLNRSGLVTALIMMSTGLDAETAIEQIRKNRGEDALFNNHYVEWLMSKGSQFLSPSSLQEIA
jgi:protein-tyrosine phosphatase